MKKYVWDVESDGLLDNLTKIHCIAVEDVVTGEQWFFGPDALHLACARLDQADLLIGHNIVAFDIPAMRRVLGWGPKSHQRVRDTLVMARLAYSDREKDDYQSDRDEVKRLSGGQSLDDWGVRLRVPKLKYTGGFAKYTEAMKDYVLQDVRVCSALYRHLLDIELTDEAVILEHRFALEAERLQARGIRLDVDAAHRLCAEMDAACEKVQKDISLLIPDTLEEMKTPAYWIVTWPNGARSVYDTKGEADNDRKQLKVRPRDWRLTKGPPERRFHPFNCNSRPQIREHLWKKYQWCSPKLTEKGEELLQQGEEFGALTREYGSVSEDILRGLSYPEARPLADFLMVKKRLGQVRDGESAWLKLVKEDGAIHHRLLHIGAATMRCAHSGPNMAQNPAVIVSKETGKPLMGLAGKFGYECRACYTAREGYVLVGTDLSGIEARMLAHFLAEYDGGKYVQVVLSGDLHALNMESLHRYAGYRLTRSATKTPFYALLYGVGALKQGQYFVNECVEAREEHRDLERYYEQNSRAITRFHYTGKTKLPYRPVEMAYADIGIKANSALERGIEGYDQLKRDTQAEASDGRLWVFDRFIPTRSKHGAINTRFQGGAAIIMKRWSVDTVAETRRQGLDAHWLVSAHDESQAEVRPGHVEAYKQIVLGAIPRTGEHYNLKIPLAGEAKVGANWAETH